MTTISITTKRPCCGRISRFQVIAHLPAETYTRRCRPCETTWDVERRTLRGDQRIRIDRFDWTDMQSGEHIRLYGAAS